MPCKFWTPVGNRRNQLITTHNINTQATIVHFIVWITYKAWDNNVAIILENPNPPISGGKSPLSAITPELQAVTFPQCAYQSICKGKPMFTPTTLMPICSMQAMHSQCQCIQPHQTLMRATVTAAGLYPLERCGKVLDIVTGYLQHPEHGVNLVIAGPIKLKREQCPGCGKYVQNRYTFGHILK